MTHTKREVKHTGMCKYVPSGQILQSVVCTKKCIALTCWNWYTCSQSGILQLPESHRNNSASCPVTHLYARFLHIHFKVTNQKYLHETLITVNFTTWETMQVSSIDQWVWVKRYYKTYWPYWVKRYYKT